MIEEAEAWSADNGLLMISPSGEMRPAPISLFPAPVPSSAFLEVRDLASVWNTLYHRIVWRDAFIEKTLEQAAYNDQFTNRLLEIYASVGRENMTKIQPFVMGIFRSDYMLHCQDGHESVFKQVEMNTISAAFAHLGAKVSRFHQFMASKFPDDERYHFHLPNNSSVETIVDTIHQAFELHPSKNSLKTAMMIIVQPGERNVVDQRGIEYALLSKHRHITIRRTLQEIKENARIDEATNNLVIDGYVVLVAYFRAGYTPKDYPSEKEWEARVLIEKSSAIKCPNIAWHLAGAKRIQQELSLSSVLSSFSCDSYDFEALLNSYTAKQWNFNDPETAKEIIENACSNTEDFVLKPQREGGGNNYYGQQMQEFLKDALSKGDSGLELLKAYVLMERIKPKSHTAVFLRNSLHSEGQAFSEFGMYSVFLSNGAEIITNRFAGHLVRTKYVGVDEGGVATGYSVLDSPALFNS